MITDKHQIVIVGGGTAGISVAARLLRKGHPDVAVIEPSEVHYYQPLWTLVGGGQAKGSTTARPEASVMPAGATWIKNAAATVDPDANTVTCVDGAVYEYDVLVVCPGIQLDWNRTEGLADALGKDGVSSNYRFDLAPRTWEFIRGLRSGTAVFAMPSGPIKCAGAPQKIAYLASDYWRKQGVLSDIDVHLVVPTPRLFGIPAIADTLDTIAADYGITVHTNAEVTSIDAAAHKAGVTHTGEGWSPDAAALRRPPHRPTSVGTGLDQVQPAVDRRCRGVRRDQQTHDAARSVSQRVQPRRCRIVPELQDRGRDTQAGAGGRREHRLRVEGPSAGRLLQRLRIMSDSDVLARDATGGIRLRPQHHPVATAAGPDQAAPRLLVSEEVRVAVHVLEPDAERTGLRWSPRT